MTIDAETMITALRLGDTQFPSGAFAFSWGLEVLFKEKRLQPGSLLTFVQNELEGRWALSDRVFLYRAMTAPESEKLRKIEDEANAMAWPSTLRECSCRAGAALLSSHVRIGTPGASSLQKDYQEGKLLGHLPVIQGALFSLLEIEKKIALSIAGYSFVINLGSAAMRLGMVGAIEVQQTTASLTRRLAELSEEPIPNTASSFSPLSDIAMMRHSFGGAGLFAN